MHRLAHGSVCAGVMLLGLSGATEVEAFSIRIPSFSMPRMSVPMPRVVPHISMPAVRMAPHTSVVRIPHNSSLRMLHTPLRGTSRVTRLPPHTPGVKRGISLAHRGSNADKAQPSHHGPTANEPRQVSTPAKARIQIASRSGSRSRSAAPGHSALCTSGLAGGWVGCGGNIWGHVGSCGHPGTTTTCAPGSWLVLQLPLPPPDLGSGDDWTDEQIPPTDSQPPYDSVAANNPPSAPPASQPDVNVATNGPPSPPPTPPDTQNSNDGNCTGPAGGTAFFGIPGNPDQPPLDCGNGSQAAANTAPADISQFPQVTEAGVGDYRDPAAGSGCSGKPNCKEIACEGHAGMISAAVITNSKSAHFKPFIMLKYTGKNAPNLKWLQFIWVEIKIRRNPGDPLQAWRGNQESLLPDLTIPINSGSLKLTTDPTQPIYGVDTLDKSQPFYGGNAVHARDATSEVIADAPGSAMHLVPNHLVYEHPFAQDPIPRDPPVYEIEQYDHFDDFLVSSTGKVCGKISWTASFASKGVPTKTSSGAILPDYNIATVEEGGKLQQLEVTQLQTQYPTYPSTSLH